MCRVPVTDVTETERESDLMTAEEQGEKKK